MSQKQAPDKRSASGIPLDSPAAPDTMHLTFLQLFFSQTF